MGGKLLLIFLLFLFLGMPVGFALVTGGISYLFQNDPTQINTYVQRIIAATQSFPLLAIPFFILVGNLMNHSGITQRMMNLAYVLTAKMVGGLAQVNIIVSTLLSGMSGSANADAAMMSKIIYPEMVKQRYSPGFSAAITATSSLIAPLIPPGIALIIFAFVTNISTGRLFMGAIIPGFILAVALMITTHLISKRREYGKLEEEEIAEIGSLWKTFMASIPALLMPIFIVIGIRFGIFTPSEAGAIAVFYALFLGLFIYKELTFLNIVESIKDTAYLSSAILFIIAASSAFSWILTLERVPHKFAEMFLTITESPSAMLILIMVFLIAVGLFIEGTASVIILAPMFYPIVTQLGIDPYHFGVIMVMTVNLGGITPPVGTIMFTTCAATKVSVGDFTRESIPFLLTYLVVSLIVIFFPFTVTLLSNL